MAGNDEDEYDDLSADDREAVRDTAYFLWEQEGRPEGRAEEFWQRALEQFRRGRDYGAWFEEGQRARYPDDGK